MLREPDKRLLARFIWNFAWKGTRAVRRFERRLARGDDFFPAFLFISVTDRCNLACQGCWVTPLSPPRELEVETLDGIVRQAKAAGCFFFGIMGGEPLLHKGIFDLFGRHPDAYFLLFTNGTLITDAVAREMRRLGNVSPLVSVEGSRNVSDERRGGENVFDRTMAGIEHCRRNRLITGAATSVCRSNLHDLATESFIRELAERGVHYLWYYIYRPVGPRPEPELALDAGQVARLRRFIVDARDRSPVLIVDSYWDRDGRAFCPAAVGMAHHIGPGGDIEFCPPIQFALDSVRSGKSLAELFRDSAFLNDFREFAGEQTRGCVLMENPALLASFLLSQGARDTSGRGTAYRELGAMKASVSHHVPSAEIPERNAFYRFAKKYWFFGFGAYG